MTRVELSQFCEYFDEKLSNCYRFDLCHINYTLDAVFYLVSKIAKRSEYFKSSASGSHKIQKVLDQIEGLSHLETKQPIVPGNLAM